MLNYLSALLPIALYVIVMRAFDAFTMVRWRSILLWLVWGVLSAFLILGLGWLTAQLNDGSTLIKGWISQLTEELIKILPLALLIQRSKVAFLAETMLYGVAIGGGFALVENPIYLNAFTDMTTATALVRGFGTTLMHMGCTALAASLMLSAMMLMAQTVGKGRRRMLSAMLTWLMLLPSMGIHIAHNILSLNPMTKAIALMIAFFMLFYLLSWVNERLIVQWLDISINDDIKLIAALQEGRLEETKAGQYLCSLRQRFEPLVFFDMTTYVLLYLQLLITAKSRMMLHDAGLDMPLSDKEKQKHHEQLVELHTIANRIPRMAHQLLQPLIHASDQNRWALNVERL